MTEQASVTAVAHMQHNDNSNSALDPLLATSKQLVTGLNPAASDEPHSASTDRELATRLRTQTPLTSEADLKRIAVAASGSHSLQQAILTQSDTNQNVSVISPKSEFSQPFEIGSSRTVESDLSLSRQNSAGQSSVQESLRQTDPTSPGQEVTSRERLPSFSQLTGSLPALAEAATQEARSQKFSSATHHRQHSQSRSSHPSQSPNISTHAPSPSIQTSPMAFPVYPASVSARSPTSNTGDGPYYGSPQNYAAYSFYAHRRTSAPTGEGALALPPALTSASSSGDSQCAPGSAGDGYSTAHTTPIEADQTMELTPRPHAAMLPPPLVLAQGGFRCDFGGCTAPPFQTQYLLTSHKNVHSQNRPHYCPVKGCSRAEGGKGFKRKNEMIRHGLVHNSPGYICPFCPEREHRYPRPDNLQRHVRVHHVDKDRDDPALQEVLNQRTEGQGKTRRRRTTGMSGSAPFSGAEETTVNM